MCRTLVGFSFSAIITVTASLGYNACYYLITRNYVVYCLTDFFYVSAYFMTGYRWKLYVPMLAFYGMNIAVTNRSSCHAYLHLTFSRWIKSHVFDNQRFIDFITDRRFHTLSSS